VRRNNDVIGFNDEVYVQLSRLEIEAFCDLERDVFRYLPLDANQATFVEGALRKMKVAVEQPQAPVAWAPVKASAAAGAAAALLWATLSMASSLF